MANITHIQLYGEQLVALLDDGSKVMAYPTNVGTWIVSGSGSGAAGFKWPFGPATWNMNNGHPEDNFRTLGRPNHNGMDMGYGIANITGTPVKAIGDGVVTAKFNNIDGSGYGIVITHTSINWRSQYKHFYQASPLNIGDSVVQGQILGGIGTTGNSTGNHLHFETYEIGIADFRDPLEFMAAYNPGNEIVS